MKKLVMGMILTAVWSANTEYVKASTYTFGKNDSKAKSENINEFGVSYREHVDRIAAMTKDVEQFLSDFSDDKSMPKTVTAAVKKMSTFLKKFYEFTEAISEDVKSSKTESAAKAALTAYAAFATAAQALIVTETVTTGLAAALVIQVTDTLNTITALHIHAMGNNVQHFLEFVAKFQELLTTLGNQLAAAANQNRSSLDRDVLIDIEDALNQASAATNRAKNFGHPETSVIPQAVAVPAETSITAPVVTPVEAPIAAPVAAPVPAPVPAPAPAPAPAASVFNFF
jgi:hypothetical protein